MKLTLDEISSALSAAGVAKEQQSKVVNLLQKTIEEKEEDKEQSKTPKVKNEFGVVLFDAANELAGKEFTACIYQIKSGDDHGTVLSKLSQAARTQNENSKRKKNLITTMADVFSGLKRKWAKEKGINLKTKEPVRVLISSNKLI